MHDRCVGIAAPSCGRPEPFDQVLDSAAAAQLPEHAHASLQAGPATAAALGTAAAQLSEHACRIAAGGLPATASQGQGRELPKGSLSMPGVWSINTTSPAAAAAPSQGRGHGAMACGMIAPAPQASLPPSCPPRGRGAKEWAVAWQHQHHKPRCHCCAQPKVTPRGDGLWHAAAT